MPRCLRRLEVDVVRADGEVGDRLDARRGVEEVAVDLLGDGGQQRVGLLRALEQVLRGAAAWSLPDVDLVLGLQPIERREGQIAVTKTRSHSGA